MKKILSVLLCGILIIGLTACGNKEETKEDFTYIGTLTDFEEDNVILTNDYMLISNDSVYAFNFDKVFSNESNYKKIGTFSNSVGLTCDYSFPDTEEHLIFNNSQQVLSCSIQDGCFEESQWKLNNSISLLNGTYHMGDEFEKILLVNNNELYSFNYDLATIYQAPPQKIDTSIIGEEKIVALYYSNSNFFIKTDKAFYEYKEEQIVTNQEECEKYADIKCNYEKRIQITRNEKLTKHYNDIKFIADGKIVFYNNKLYSFE